MNNNITAAGIIAEYNPLHTGHIYHINATREITGADCIVAVMSGNFVQRGEPAIIDKFARARIAIKCGADLVIELPVISATGSAGYFAMGAVSILNAINADFISFGSESGDISSLTHLSDIISSNYNVFNQHIGQYTSEGLSFPAARAKAFCKCFPGEDYSILDADNSNNILALEYLLELKKTKSDIKPVTVKRMGNGYNDSSLGEKFSSATSIRNSIFEGTIPEAALGKECTSILKEYSIADKLVTFDDFTEIIRYRLLGLRNRHKADDYSIIAGQGLDISDMPPYLENKLIKQIYEFENITQLIKAVKTKDLTYTRISRALCHLLLDITENDICTFTKNPCSCIRVLGLNDTGALFLSQVKKKCPYPIITKAADYKNLLTFEAHATDIYNLAIRAKSKAAAIKNEFNTPIASPACIPKSAN